MQLWLYSPNTRAVAFWDEIEVLADSVGAGILWRPQNAVINLVLGESSSFRLNSFADDIKIGMLHGLLCRPTVFVIVHQQVIE